MTARGPRLLGASNRACFAKPSYLHHGRRPALDGTVDVTLFLGTKRPVHDSERQGTERRGPRVHIRIGRSARSMHRHWSTKRLALGALALLVLTLVVFTLVFDWDWLRGPLRTRPEEGTYLRHGSRGSKLSLFRVLSPTSWRGPSPLAPGRSKPRPPTTRQRLHTLVPSGVVV